MATLEQVRHYEALAYAAEQYAAEQVIRQAEATVRPAPREVPDLAELREAMRHGYLVVDGQVVRDVWGDAR